MAASARSIPAFAKDFPDNPRLDRLVDLFEQGNFAQVRIDARALLKSTEEPAVRSAARELLKRLEPDPIALYLLAISAGLLVILAGYYWTHAHEPPPPPPAPAPTSHVAP
jgi:hypothetical protein